MDSIVSSHFEKILNEYRLWDEVRNCIDHMISQVELNEKDQIM